MLTPGGVCILTFSNRLFYSKAIAAWRDGSGYARAQLVRTYFQAVEGFTAAEVVTDVAVPAGGTSLLERLQRVFARGAGDPFYAVLAYRNYKPA